jgi:BlaI family transcriptional regulator, penicillinase repressor
MGRKEPPALSEAQIEIMNVVWQQGEVTLGQVYAELSAGRDVARNTVQTLLTRLVEKGWLRYRAEGKVHHYRAARPKEATLRGMVHRMVETAFGGSTEGLVMALLDGQKLSKEEAARIRDLIAQAEQADNAEEQR